MGMKIDEVIQSLTAMKSVIGVNQLTINEAVENIRKYQKILKILNSTIYFENGKVYSYTYDDTTRLRHIREVIEDGKID